MKKGLRLPRVLCGGRYCSIPTADLMKKGLRRNTPCNCRPLVYSNRRPDEEGIKTAGQGADDGPGVHSNRRPDEEGIKTTCPAAGRCSKVYIPTADLMKKGLRPPPRSHLSHRRRDSNRRPDEEGIKTHPGMQHREFAADSNRRPDEEGIKTPADHRHLPEEWNSNRRPDEEGIKTPCPDRLFRRQLIPTADLMKKGLRHSLSDTPHKSVAFQPQT